ncbi:MAG: dockerin type I domain-containing protein [Patescibacteria group bacterium]
MNVLLTLLLIFQIFIWGLPQPVFATFGDVQINAIVPGCGDGIIESGEECDGSNLNSKNCSTQGFSGGTLSCTASCTFNTLACTSGGGGGGGGGGSPPPTSNTTVNFFGKAYPKSVVTILKDAQIVTTVAAGTDANFQTSVTNLSAGNYIFSVYSEDKDGRRSGLLTFPVSVTAGATTNITGIFLAPTIATDKSEVKKGENIAIFGQAAPDADIVISVNSTEEFFAKTISDKNGVYLNYFDTTFLDYGAHTTKSKASIGNQLVSTFSPIVNFTVDDKNVVREKKAIVSTKSDLNGDGKVNLIDFSITTFWYNKPNPPVKIDLNNDGKINLIDFSIMAYYWTG